MLPRRWHFNRLSLTRKLALIMVLVVALPGIVFMMPYSYLRHSTGIKNEQSAWMEGQAHVVLQHLENTLDELTYKLERQIYRPADYADLEEYLYLAPYTTSPTARAELQRFIERKVTNLLTASTSLSRIRFMAPDGTLLVDGARYSGVINIRHSTPLQSRTPADSIIATTQYGPWNTVTEIYADTRNIPSIDVIYTLRAPWDLFGTGPLLGLVVFTQNLELAAADTVLPDIYAALELTEQPAFDTRVYLLSSSGALLSPDARHMAFYDARTSKGFQLAQRGSTGITEYDSLLFGKNVLGYRAGFSRTNLPRFTLLVETNLSDIESKAIRGSLGAFLGFAAGFLTLSLIGLYIMHQAIIRPIREIDTIAREIAGGSLTPVASTDTPQDEIGRLGASFHEMSAQMLDTINVLEQRVAERTRNLEITLEIGRVLTSIRDLDILLEEVVNLIRARFPHIYHVQVFLIDPTTHRANLRASTGPVGRTLLEKRHFLEVGSQSVIGSVTSTGNAVVALDTSNNPIHRRNEFLPDTRAEMALPLRSSERIIGALDLQSVDPNAFSDQDVELFQGMADQITVAIENATLFAESNMRLNEIERLNRTMIDAAWVETMRAYGTDTLSAAIGSENSDSASWSALQQDAIQSGAIAERTEGDTVIIAVPVRLRDQVLGAIEWQVPRAHYTSNTRRTAEELSNRLALSIDNIRLFEESRQAAHREQLVNRISSQLIGQTDINQILQTAVRELGLALRVPRTVIRLTPSDLETSND